MFFRKSLSVVFLIVLVLLLAACRRGADDTLPTPASTSIVLATASPTLPVGATSTVATAVPSTATNTSTPLVITAPVTTAPATTAPTNPTATPGLLTPAPVCTPPACGPGQTYACPSGNCPGGCGTVCVGPTANPNPPPGGATRITFAPGATSATVSSVLAAGGDGDTWLLNVGAGQVINVQTIANPPGNMVVSLLDMNGGTLATNNDTVAISSAVPTSGDYQINLATASGAPAVSYTLQVIIPAAGGPVTPARIQYQPGQSSAQLVDSLTAGGDLNSYVLSVGAGQQIQVGVFASPPDATTITIRDSAGRYLTQGTDMSGAVATAATAGDYYIDVGNYFAAPVVNYTLTVTTPPLNPPPPVQPIRIAFGPGQISAQLDGSVAVGLPPVEYIIGLAAGQELLTDLNDNPQGNADVTVRDLAGNVLNFGRAPTSLGTEVPVTGDYIIVISTMSTAAVNYSLVVTAPPQPGAAQRIEFAPGASSATVGGDIPFGGDTDNWVIRGGPGQTMHVTMGVAEATGWVRVFIYNEAGMLLGLGTDISGVSAPMVTNNDYRIVIISDQAAGPLSYSMTVTIN